MFRSPTTARACFSNPARLARRALRPSQRPLLSPAEANSSVSDGCRGIESGSAHKILAPQRRYERQLSLDDRFSLSSLFFNKFIFLFFFGIYIFTFISDTRSDITYGLFFFCQRTTTRRPPIFLIFIYCSLFGTCMGITRRRKGQNAQAVTHHHHSEDVQVRSFENPPGPRCLFVGCASLWEVKFWNQKSIGRLCFLFLSLLFFFIVKSETSVLYTAI